MSYEYPPSKYAVPILASETGSHWPVQSEHAWGAFAKQMRAEWGRLFQQEDAQSQIRRDMWDQSGPTVNAINALVAHRSSTLADRLEALRIAVDVAEAVESAIISLKADLYWIVMNADQRIKDAEARAGIGAAVVLGAEISSIIGEASGEAAEADILRAAQVAAKATELMKWKPDASAAEGSQPGAATMMSNGIGGASAPAPLSPHSGAQAVDYNTMKDAGGTNSPVPDKKPETPEKSPLSKQAQEAAFNPDKAKDAATMPDPNKSPASSATPPVHQLSPPSSAPSSGGGSPASSGGGSSVLGSMMRPMSSSPASSSSPAAGAGKGMSPGGPASVNPAAAHGGAPGGSPAGAGAPGGAGGGAPLRGATSAAGIGSGIAESGARMGAGAISGAANTLGSAGNAASQVAQGASAAAAQAAPPAAAAAGVSGVPAGGVPAAGGPVAMVPPAAMSGVVAAGPPAVSGSPNVGPGVPGTPPPQGAPGAVAPTSLTGASASSGGAPVPVAVPMQQMQAVSAADGTGEVLIAQAADAARSIVESLIAQTKKAGYGSQFAWAVSVIYDRTGAITAWLASGEGPSYIPLGVRVPDDVRLAVTDAVVGRQLWDESAAAGGTDPLKLLARHAEMLTEAAPGSRVLALASSLPAGRVSDWAGTVGARPVHVDGRTVDGASANGWGQHRCAAAMPWEWRQANMFSEQQRLQVAAQQLRLAAEAGHLNDPRALRVIELFERRKPISDSDWADVKDAGAKAFVEYMAASMSSNAVGGTDPTPVAWAFRTARAAEVVLCARESATAEGCADLLYATRLAGAPLNPSAAVA